MPEPHKGGFWDGLTDTVGEMSTDLIDTYKAYAENDTAKQNRKASEQATAQEKAKVEAAQQRAIAATNGDDDDKKQMMIYAGAGVAVLVLLVVIMKL